MTKERGFVTPAHSEIRMSKSAVTRVKERPGFQIRNKFEQSGKRGKWRKQFARE